MLFTTHASKDDISIYLFYILIFLYPKSSVPYSVLYYASDTTLRMPTKRPPRPTHSRRVEVNIQTQRLSIQEINCLYPLACFTLSTCRRLGRYLPYKVG